MQRVTETQDKILKNSSKCIENSSKIFSKLNQNLQKPNIPEIPVASSAAKTTKKACSCLQNKLCLKVSSKGKDFI